MLSFSWTALTFMVLGLSMMGTSVAGRQPLPEEQHLDGGEFPIASAQHTALLARSGPPDLSAEHLKLFERSPRASSDEAPRSLSKRSPAPGLAGAIKVGASATCEAKKSGDALGVSWATDYTVTMKGWGEVADKCGRGLLDNLRGDCKGSAITSWTCVVDSAGNAVATWRMPKINNFNCVENAIYHASWNEVGGIRCTGANNVGDAIGSVLDGAKLVGEVVGGRKGGSLGYGRCRDSALEAAGDVREVIGVVASLKAS